MTDSPTRRRSALRLRWPITAFLTGAWFLDVQLPGENVNVGNLFLVGGATLALMSTIWTRRRKGIRGISIMGHDVVYALYLLFAASSALWAPSAMETLVHSSYLAIVWFAALNLADGDADIAVRFTVSVAVLTALMSIAIIPVSPSMAFQPNTSTALPELRGIFSHQLRLGLLMSIALGLSILALANGRYGRGVIARGRFLLAGLVISACLIGAFARLYTLAMVVALGLTFAVSKPGWKRGGTILIGAACTAGILLSLDHLGARLLALNADLTLTGRTTMWARTLAVLGDAEWVGRGYAAFDHPSYDWMWAAYRPAHPHNSFIQAYFETGYVGLGLTIALVISHLRIALRVSRVTGRYSYSLFLVLLAGIGSLTGSNYAGKPTLLFSLMLLVLGIESRQVLVAARVRGNRIVPIAATKNARAAIR